MIKTHRFNWKTISANKFIKMNDIVFHYNLPWDFQGVSQNPNLNIYYVKLFHNQGKKLNWNSISKHPKITMDDMRENPRFPWNPRQVALNPNITTEFITTNNHWKWDYTLLSQNPNIKLEFVFQNISLPWSWTCLSSHPKLNARIILKYPHLPWNWYHISANPAFKISTFQKHKHLKISYKGFSCNPNLSMNFVIQNLDFNWDISGLCYNRFQTERNRFYEYHMRRYFMAKKIAVFWKETINDFSSYLGFKISKQRYDKLNREYDQLYIDEEEANRLLEDNQYC